MDQGTVDAAVVGAGPAGCSAAIYLARQGLEVALLEAGEVGRHKLCGEFLSPECGDLLNRLGLADAVGERRPFQIHAARLTAPEGTASEMALPGSAWGLSRSALEAALWEGAIRAGARGLDKAKVQSVTGDLGHSFRLETTRGDMEARTVILAHGRRDTLDRVLERAFLRHAQPYLALKAHFVGPPLNGRVHLHFFPGGYCGLAEIEGGLVNVCLLVREAVFRSALRSGLKPAEAFLGWMKGQNRELGEWLQHAQRIDRHWLSVAQLPFTIKGTVERDMLMAGDAAALVVPLVGDGIAMALQSGMMAGDLGASFLRGERSSRELTHDYAANWGRTFGERVRLGEILQSLVIQPRLVGAVLRALNRAPFLAGYLVTHTRARAAAAWPVPRR